MLDVDDLEVLPELPELPGIPAEALHPPALPPSHVVESLHSIMADISSSVAAIPDGADGAIIGQYSRNKWVGAVVMKAPHGFQVKAWIGQERGKEFDYGVGVVKTFKW